MMGGVSRVGVALVSGLMVVQEKLGHAAIGQPRDARGVAQPVLFKREILGAASVGEPVPFCHSAASLVSRGAWSPWQSHLSLWR